jgi:hypothetical protein
MKKVFILLVFLATSLKSQTAPTYSIYSQSGSFVISCLTPTVLVFVSANNQPITFTCTGPSGTSTGTNAPITIPGTHTLITQWGINLRVYTPISIGINTTLPISSLSSTFQVVNATQTPQTVSITAVSPTVNITHFVYSPQGGTFVANAPFLAYFPASPGTYTHCIVDNTNGCSSCHQFTISLKETSTGLLMSKNFVNTLSLFPNPASNKLYVRGWVPHSESGTVRVCIINSLGEKIQEELIDTRSLLTGINTNQLSNGVYFLQLISAENGNNEPEKISQRFIISR